MPGYDDNYGYGNGSRTKDWADYQRYVKDAWTNQWARRGGEQVARGLLGGPVGWYELASGKSLLGGNDPFNGTTINRNMTEDVYNAMTPQEWQAFAKMSDDEQANFISSKSREVAKGKSQQDAADKAQAALDKQRSDREAAQADLIKKVQAFADEMNMPIDQLMQKDGFAQALRNTTYQNSMGNAMNTGAGAGGLSQANADQTTKNALLGYQFQRQQAGQQALGNAFNMIGQQNATAEDIARYNQNMNLQMQALQAQRQAADYQQGLSRSGGTLGLVGAGLGAYFGGAAGAQAGYQIGSGIGQQNYQTSNPYQAYRYTYPSSTRGGGLGGSY